VQSFHLFDENQMVIKTQAIIEVARKADWEPWYSAPLARNTEGQELHRS
jgi:predicted DCC family thiol-disulfide oxidoreductase YuxK